jgi:hypothetical protein
MLTTVGTDPADIATMNLGVMLEVPKCCERPNQARRFDDRFGAL